MKKYLGKIKYVILTTLIVLFLFTTVAYSGLASKLAITSEVMFRALADIRVTNIKLEKTTGNALESYEPKYNVDATTTGFELPSADSSITYRVTVTNRGKRNQTIYEFIKNSINADGVNIKIEGYTEKDIIPYESSIDFLITFTTTNPSNQTINVIEKYDFREVYTIEYDANGGTNAPKEQIKYQKEDIALREEIPTRGTYKFVGWSETQGSETAEYKAGGAYTLDKDVILYAVWQKNATKIDLNYNVDGTWYYSGYNNRIQTGIKVNGEDQGYLNDFGQTYDYGTSYEIYGFKLDGEEIPYSKKYTVDGTNHLGIYFNTMNFTVNDESLGSISHEQLIVIPGITYKVTNSTITMSDGRIVTASPKTVTGYTTKFTGYTITPNSTTINAKTTVKANFTKEANTYKITLDNKSATTAGTTSIYEKYNTGIYLDSDLKTTMTTSANPITKPVKTGYTFKGYYTKEKGQGDQIINADGYITEVITNTTYTANTTLYAYYVDEEKPTLTLTNSSNENWTNKDVTITLNGADSGSGIKEYQWKENGAWTTRAVSITNGVGSITYTVDRNLEIEFRVIDNAGNISDVKKTYVRRDTVAPKIELNGTASSSEINNSNSVTIPIKITETASGMNSTEFTASDISVLINGTSVNPSTKTLTYNSVSNGVYSYTLTLSGITLNGKVTLEIASGAVKDIATNSSVKTTLDPSITVSNAYTISLNGNGATTVGTTAIYEKYNTGIYLDSVLANAMTTSANPITKPTRSYTVSFNANNTGITMPSAITKSYSYSGYYTDVASGTQMINENGYITSSFTKTSYTANATLYAHWKAKPSVTIPSISKTGYTCSWNTSADGKGTTYNGGDVTDKLNTQTLYAVCAANTYTVTYNSNGGSGTMTNDTATYNSNYITKKNTFIKTGYTFNGWNEKADGTGKVWGLTTSGVYESGKSWKWTYTKNITLYAQWKANTNTKYVVKHYKQKLDGTYPSEADDTDELTGTTDSSMSPAVKSYAGFTSPSVQTVTIAADGSTVVTYKYARNKYIFTLGSTTGITTTGSTASGSYYYGSTITLKATESAGYTFNGWTSSNTNLVANQTNASATFTMPAGNITMTPSITAKSLTFNDQSKAVTYNKTTDQSVSISAATGGSGSYSYSITSGNASYFSISGTTITVKAATPASTYTIKVTATDNNTKVTKEATITLVVNKKSVTKPTSPADKVYNAAEQSHGIKTLEGASIVTSGSTLKATNVNAYNVVFTLNSNYKWSDGTTTDVTVTWKITAYNLSNATIESVDKQTYTGSAITPKPNVKVPIPSGKTTMLASDTDYTYSYSNNTNAGTGTVKVTGKGNYTGTKSITFEIGQAENPVKVTANDLTYNTSSQALVTTSGAKGTICYSLDSVITNKCSTSTAIPTGTNAGTYTVYYYVNGTSNYKDTSGSVIVTIKKYNISNAVIGTINDQIYTGNPIKPTPLVTASMPNSSVATLVNNADYTYSYSNNTNAGTGKVTVTGIGNYTGTKSKTFNITKATNPTVITANTLTYNAEAQVLVTSSKEQGYICYSLSALPTSCTSNSDLPKGTNAGTYTVYYMVSESGNYNKKTGSVKVTIDQYDISKGTLGSVSDQAYTGSAVKPTPSVIVPIPSGKTTTLVNNTDYTYSYSNNTSVGTGTVTVTGKGNYKGTKSTTFKITPKASSCTITSVPTLKYPSSTTGSIQFKCTGDGAITVTSSNTGIIEVTSTGTTGAGLKGKAAGTSKITISQAAGNYAASSVSADVTVTYSTYEVTLNSNGATTQGSTSAVATYNGTTLSTITNPKREYTITYDVGQTGITKPANGKVEYKLNGWYTASSNGTKVASAATTPVLEASVNGYTNASKQWTKTSAATLYAGWNAGSTTLAVIEKEGNTCTWIDNNGNSYNSGQTGFTATSNRTLTARCLPKSYVLTVNPNEGTWNNTTSASTVTRSYGTQYTVADPTRTGYKFAGWTLSGKGSWNSETKKYTFGAGAGTLTANWTSNTLTFNGKSETLSYNSTSNQTVSLSPATGGTGSYSYSIVDGNADNYFSISGTTITVKAGTPANTYTIKVRATDTKSKAIKDATITIIINKINLSGSVIIEGTNTWGQKLTAKVTNTNGANLTYQWYFVTTNATSGGTKIANATSSEYIIDKSLVGKYIYVVVSASKANYNTAEWKDITDSYENKTLTVAKQSLSVTVTPYSGKYDGKEHYATIKVNSGSWNGQTIVSGIGTSYGNTVTSTGVTGTTYNLLPSRTDASTAAQTIYYKVTGGTYYKDSTGSTTIKIEKVDNIVKVEAVKNLEYGSTAALVTVKDAQGSMYYSVGIELTSSNFSTSGSTTIPTAYNRNATTYRVYYYNKGNTNYNEKAGYVDVVIGKKTNPITVKGNTNAYGTKGNLVTVSGAQGTVYYSVDKELTSSNYSTVGKTDVPTSEGLSGGTHKVYYYATGNDNYKSAIGNVESVIKPVTNPTTFTKKYIKYGTTEELTTINNKQGTIYYSIGTQLTSSNYSTAGSTEVPTGYDSSTNTYRNVGTYTIYYYIPSTSNYNEKTGSIDGVISKANAVNPKLTSYEGKYDGQAHTIKVEGGSGGTIKYRTSTSDDYSETLPTATNVGVTTVYVKVIGDANHNSSSEISAKITITAADFPDGSGSVTITGTNTWGQTLTANVINTENATLTYQWYSTDNTTATGGTAIGGATRSTYTIDKSFVGKKIYVVVTAKKTNYNTAEWKDITDSNNKTVEVAKQDLSVTATPYNGSYNGTAHNATIKVNSVSWDGQTIVSGTSTSYGNTVTSEGVKATAYNLLPSKTDAGTYPIYYKVTGGHYYNDLAGETTVKINTVNLAKPTNIKISTAGIVTWDAVANAVSYQISMDGTNYETAKSGVDYLSKITKTSGVKTIYVKAIGNNNYVTSSAGTTSTTVYTVTINSNSTTMGTVDTSSYNVISGATYSVSSNKLSFIGITSGTTTKTLKTVTGTAKSNYTFSNWSSTTGSVTSNVALTANFVGSEYTISLNPNGGTGGTSAIYERYNKGIYLDSGTNSKQMTTSANPISLPSKGPYTISFKGVSNPFDFSFSPTFNGYYTATSSGTQMINNTGYITSNLTSPKYTSNTTLYAQWDSNFELYDLVKTGYDCSWNTSEDGTGTEYAIKTKVSINSDTTFYAICNAKKSKVTFDGNGGTVTTKEMEVTYNSPYGTLPTPTRSDTIDEETGKTISYVFEGWYTKPNGGYREREEDICIFEDDATLYAHWISKPIITGGSAEWFNKEVNIALEVPSTSDTGSVKYQYYVSTSNSSQVGGEWKDTSESGYAPVTTDGIHYVFYRAISSAGVYSDISNYQTLKIDTANPTLSVTGNPTSWVTTDVTLKVSASDSTSGLKNVTVNGKALSLSSGIVNYTVSANGTYTFVATDIAGNTTTQSVVVSKIDKVTPTAPVLTGGSDSDTSSCVTIQIGKAGTTGPSGIQKYEAELENMLNGAYIHRSYNQITYKDNGYWQTTGTDPYVAFDDIGNAYMTHARVSFASPTPVAMNLQVFYWTAGSSPTGANSKTVNVPAGTSGYVDVDIPDGTYDGLRFDFGNTANVTYQFQFWGYVQKYSRPDEQGNYSTVVCNRGLNRVRYRTLANNGLISNWSDYDTDNKSHAFISNESVLDTQSNLRYSTLSKAINLLAGQGGSQYLRLLRNISNESVSIQGYKNYSLNMMGFSINSSQIVNHGQISLTNGLLNNSASETETIVSYGQLSIQDCTIISKSKAAVSVGDGNVSIEGSKISSTNARALYAGGGTITITNTNISSTNSHAINQKGGTLNYSSGTITVYGDSNGLNQDGGSFVIGNGASITAKNGSAINSTGSITVNQATLTSNANGINMNSGTVTINSGASITSKSSGIRVKGTVNVNGGTITSDGGNGIIGESDGTINIYGGEIIGGLSSGVYSAGSFYMKNGTVRTQSAGKNGVYIYSGTAKMEGGSVLNVVDNNSCSGAFTLASTSTKGFTMSGGIISGCVGINYQSGATGKIAISGSAAVSGAHTGIKINSTTSKILTIGTSGSTSTNPKIASEGDYYAVDLGSSSYSFTMYSGQLISSKSGVFRGKRAGSCASGKTWTVTSSKAYCK